MKKQGPTLKRLAQEHQARRQKKHRIYLNKAKVDHFVEFSNRPYFYQDVSYGTRVLKLQSGERLTMPNVIRTVTKSALISEYQRHCTETELRR